ncbi:unnamed protein product [Brachionus calyciflorus]|uniref:Uncharacterized protein n=1 Tax=Brachionus calyciflorus TaxID=104777 RepID=A0A814KHQ5_9BILA|nr:unnamed protein product [Brachionus calyciflorus]
MTNSVTEMQHLNLFLDYIFQYYDPETNHLRIGTKELDNYKLLYLDSYETLLKLLDLEGLDVEKILFYIIFVFFYIEDEIMCRNEPNYESTKFNHYLLIFLKENFKINDKELAMDEFYELLKLEFKIERFIKSILKDDSHKNQELFQSVVPNELKCIVIHKSEQTDEEINEKLKENENYINKPVLLGFDAIWDKI